MKFYILKLFLSVFKYSSLADGYMRLDPSGIGNFKNSKMKSFLFRLNQIYIRNAIWK